MLQISQEQAARTKEQAARTKEQAERARANSYAQFIQQRKIHYLNRHSAAELSWSARVRYDLAEQRVEINVEDKQVCIDYLPFRIIKGNFDLQV